MVFFYGGCFTCVFKSISSFNHSGSTLADQVLEVLAGTSMFVGGVMAFLLDNTIPGE